MASDASFSFRSFRSYYCVLINDEICYLSIYIFTCISFKVIYFIHRRNKEKADSFCEHFRYAEKMMKMYQDQTRAYFIVANHSKDGNLLSLPTPRQHGKPQKSSTLLSETVRTVFQ